ncbi:hypothetical protein D3C76_1834790 [compost metagenome]
MNSPRGRAVLKAEESALLASDGADAIERFHQRLKELNKRKNAVDEPHQEFHA